MIPNITKGANIARSVQYLASPANGHENARIVGGNLGLEGEALTGEMVEQVSRELEAPHLASGQPEQRVWCCSLSLPPEDGVRSDEWWAAVAERAVADQGFAGQDPVRWIAVRHGLSQGKEGQPGNDHVHIALVRVRESGKLARDSNERYAVKGTCRALEREHGLTPGEKVPGVSRRGLSHVEWERTSGGRTLTERQYIEQAIRGCMTETRDLDAFAARMDRGGLPVTFREKGGQRVGYSVMGRDGFPYQGGKIARDLTLPRLERYWRTTEPDLADEARRAAGRLAMESLKRENGTPGPLARESRHLARFAQTRVSAGPLLLSTAMTGILRSRLKAAEAEAERLREEQDRGLSRRPHRAPERGADLGI